MRSRHLPFSILQAILVLLLALAPAPAAAEGAPSRLDTVVLQLKWMHQFQFAGYYAAKEKGFYRDVGLDVILEEAIPGQDITDELISGRADYLVNNPSALLDRIEGKEVVALAAIFQHSPLVIVSRIDSRIFSPSDLIGRRVMAIPKTESELVAMCLDQGVKLDQIDIGPHSRDVADLISGRVDAMSAYLTDVPFVLQKAGVAYSLLRPQSYGIDFYGDLLLTTENEIATHPGRVEAFREASLRGWAYAMEHPEEIIDLIVTQYGSRLSVDELRFEANAMQDLVLAQLIKLGYMNPVRWQHIADTYIKLGMLPEDFSLEGFLYESPQKGVFGKKVLRWLVAALVLSGIGVLVLLLFNQRLRIAVQRRTEALRESEERLRQLADSMPQLVWSADGTGRVDYYNERRSEFRGFSQKPDGSWEWMPVLHPDDIQKTLTAWNGALRTGHPYQVEHRVQRADGSFGWFLSRAIPIRNRAGEVVRWYGTTTDIDDLKKVQIALNEARRSAEEANRVKGEFLANMSHEIRTPITGIISAIELLSDIEEDPEHLRILELASISTRRLHLLIEGILDFSKLEADKMDLEEAWFDVSTTLEETLELEADKAKEKNLGLELDISPDVPRRLFGDRDRVKQILVKIIENAIKFTDTGGIVLSAHCRENFVEFVVTDTGIGIPKEKVREIFDVFSQADGSITRRHGGTGLGLAVAKALAELMGGEIAVKSEAGRGSAFTFRLPLRSSQA